MKTIHYKTQIFNYFRIVLLACTCLVFLAPGLNAQQQLRAKRLSKLEPVIEKNSSDRFINFRKDFQVKALDLFEVQKQHFGFDSDDRMIAFSVEEAYDGDKVYRFQQYYKDLPVALAVCNVIEKKGKVDCLVGDWVAGIDLDITPQVSEYAALQYALAYFQASLYRWELAGEAGQLPEGSLCIINDQLNQSGEYHLAWCFLLDALTPEKKSKVYVDAHSGNILHDHSQIFHDQLPYQGKAQTLFSGNRDINMTHHSDLFSGESYYTLYDLERGNGIETRDAHGLLSFVSSRDYINDSPIWGAEPPLRQQGFDVHWGLGTSKDYFQAVFNHAGFNKNTSPPKITAYANVGFANNDASWNGLYFQFGSGDGVTWKPVVSLDIVAHEYTHAITEATTNLLYYGESGAIHEGFSDIFGSAVEGWAKPPLNWFIGENAGIMGPLRSLSNPKSFSQPDTYGAAPLWVNPITGGDEGGVHTNCAIMNHWFYILSVGKSGTNDLSNQYRVTGIGHNNALLISYLALTKYVLPVSDYHYLRFAMIKAAFDLCSDSCHPFVVQTKNAWHAVGVGAATMTLAQSIVAEPTCNQSNGLIDLTVLHVAPQPATYQWSNDKTTAMIEELSKGDYSVTITDPNSGCTKDTTFILEESDAVEITTRFTDETGCHLNDGTATVLIVEGGGDNPKIRWSNDGRTGLIRNLPGGDYTVTVTNRETNCKASETVHVEPYLPIVEIQGGGKRKICTGKKAKLKAVAQRCEQCQFFWSTGETGETIEVAASDFYSVVAMDKDFCADQTAVQVEIEWKDCNSSKYKKFKVRLVRPEDPNEIIGPEGYGNPAYMARADALPYKVNFENDPTVATAPATKVVVEVPIPPKAEIFSFRLGDVGFGSFQYACPPNQLFHSARFDLTDSLGVYVDMTAGIDVNNNKAFWIFQSIDPATGLVPVDPFLGFLPVNDSLTGSGEGYVNFTLKPKSSALTGDTITARASIVFDFNEAIPTNTWKNTIDALAPQTGITALPASIDSTTIELLLFGNDDPNGSGLKHIILYYNENQGIFYKHGEYQAGVPVPFSGEAGKTYGFFTRGIDQVGNQEAMKGTAETQTLLRNPGPTVSGHVRYASVAQTPLSLLHLSLRSSLGVEKDTAITNSQGYYFMEANQPGLFSILTNTSKPWGGVNATDALVVLRHFVELEQLSGLRLQAADVNASGNINANDAWLIAKRFVTPETVFAAGDWLFQQDNLEVPAAGIVHDFQGICTGDADASYQPSSAKTEAAVRLIYQGVVNALPGQEIRLPIRVKEAMSLGAVSLILRLPEELLELKGLILNGPAQENLQYALRDGELRIAWYDRQALPLEKDEPLLWLCLKPRHDNLLMEIPLVMEKGSVLASDNGREYPQAELYIPRLKLENTWEDAIVGIHPNPFSQSAKLNYLLPEDAHVNIRLLNLLGQEVMLLKDEWQTRGGHDLPLDGNKIEEGSYLIDIQIITKNETQRELMRVVKIR